MPEVTWPLATVLSIALLVIGSLVTSAFVFRARRLDLERRHREFKMSLRPQHEETLAKIAASRESELAKYGSKNKVIEHRSEEG